MSRISARETLMKLVFEFNFNNKASEIEEVLEEENLNEEDKTYIKDNLEGIKNNFDEILDIIKNNLINYKLERICKTDLAILIVAIYEIKFINAPNKIIINEAVELSKKYSLDNSYKFVNGLLAKVVN